MSQTYEQRKIRALMGLSVLHRDDAALPQVNASDQWRRLDLSPSLSEAPVVTGAYAQAAKRSSKQKPVGFVVPRGSIQAGSLWGSAAPPVPAAAGLNPQTMHFEPPRPTMEFDLHHVPTRLVVLEMAPDQSKYVVPNAGDLGRAIFQ